MYSRWHSAKQFYPCVDGVVPGGGSPLNWVSTGLRSAGICARPEKRPRWQMQPGAHRVQVMINQVKRQIQIFDSHPREVRGLAALRAHRGGR